MAQQTPSEVEEPKWPPEATPDNGTVIHNVADGGLKAWCTVIGGFLAIAAVFGYQNAFGVYQDVYVRSHAASPQAVSWIGSTQLSLMVALGLPAGKLLDSGYFKVMTVTGSVIYVFSLFMVSIAHTDKYYQLFLAQGLAAGIGAGLVYLPAVAVQSHHWRRRRPVAMGIVISGSPVGGVVFPIMLNHLFENPRFGFTWGVRTSAFLCLALLVLANLLMTANPPKAKKPEPPKLTVLLKDTPYVIGVVGCTIAFWGLFFPYFYLQLFAIIKGADPNFAFYLLSILNGSSIPGRIIPNALGQKLGLFNALVFCTFACGVLIFGLIGVNSSTGGLVTFSVLYGFFSGGFISLLPPAIASLAADDSEIGIRMGLAYFISSVGSLTGTPIDGALLGQSFAWWRPITFSGVMMFAGLILIVITRGIVSRRVHSMRA
ncbi:hypothetical protein VNI00_006668 [Paramarasmius palmivorus]|uniref:Uncharacterized protein n=1 Tax=Paramarasmius palmivorus TaxID=297713 RepID=A0AAW0DAZ6_9AGAR